MRECGGSENKDGELKMYNLAVFLGELQLDTQRKVLEGIVEAARADGNNVIVYCLTLSNDDELRRAYIPLRSGRSSYQRYLIRTSLQLR